MLSAILNTWLPRSNFIYSNNTLLAAGCCKSKLRYLKHWYRLLFLISSSGLACENIRFSSLFVSQASPGLVKPILGHSFGRSWYMRLFHTPRTSFLLTTRLWKHISCSGVIFIPEKNLRAPSSVYLRSVTSGRILCYPITATSRFWMCHTICWMVLCQAFLSLLPPLPSPIKNLVSPIPLGRPDTQAIHGRAKSTLICMWYLSCKAGLLRTFPLFSPETSKLESGCSLLRIEVFLPGFSLLLNAQRNLHKGWFN